MSGAEAQPGRRSFLDLLRVGATLLLFPYHAARMFDYVPWYVKNPQPSLGLEWFTRFVELWHMPLFFLVSGGATWCFFESGRGERFLRDRAKKLLLPLFFGVLVLVPPVTYVRHLALQPGDPGGFFVYYPSYFHLRLTGLDGMTGTLTPLHLWFILYLFLFSALAAPLFSRMSREPLRSRVRDWNRFLLRGPGLCFLPALLPAAARLTAIPYPNPVYFFSFYFLGYWLLQDGRLLEKAARLAKPAALLAAGFSAWILWSLRDEMRPSWIPSYGGALSESLLGWTAWLWLIAGVGLAQSGQGAVSTGWAYLQQAAYPVYLLHMTPIVLLGYALRENPLAPAAKYVILTLSSAAICLGLYEMLLKRVKGLWIWFGIRPAPAAAQGGRSPSPAVVQRPPRP